MLQDCRAGSARCVGLTRGKQRHGEFHSARRTRAHRLPLFALFCCVCSSSAFIVMYQTTGTQSQCPGGWIPADQHGWPTDPNNLPCSFLNVTSRFGAQWNNPIVPFPQPSYPGSSFYSTQALDVYDCTLNESRQQIWPCGFVPQWKVDPDNMQQLVLITSDPIVSASQQQNTPNEAAPIPSSVRAGGLMRSPVDLPLSEWSIPAPVNLWFSSSWIAFVHIEVNDQTENLIAGFARTLPWQPTGYIDQNPSPPYGTPTPPLVINSASGTPPQPGTTVGSLDDIMWQSQLFVDANASVVTPTCKVRPNEQQLRQSILSRAVSHRCPPLSLSVCLLC